MTIASQDSSPSLRLGARVWDVLSLRSASVMWGIFSKTFHKILWGMRPSGTLQRCPVNSSVCQWGGVTGASTTCWSGGGRALSELRSKNQNQNQLAGAETHGNQLRGMNVTVGLRASQVAIPAASGYLRLQQKTRGSRLMGPHTLLSLISRSTTWHHRESWRKVHASGREEGR